MHKFLRNRNVLLCASFHSMLVEELDFDKYKEARGLYIEDPWERVKSVFSKSEYGAYHPELIYAVQNAQFGALLGVFLGGLRGSIEGANTYFRTNDANIYIDRSEAYKKLNNTSLFGFLKGAYRCGPIFGIFFGSYSLISSCVELYRNKIGIIDKVIAGAALGALHRIMFGYKGILVGGVLGGILGTIYGVVLWGATKLTNTDELRIKYAQYARINKRKMEELQQQQHSEADEKTFDIKESALHVKHISNPLDALEDEEEKDKKKHQNKKK